MYFSDDITKEDFKQTNWEQVIAEAEEKECHSYAIVFGKRAREADLSGNTKVYQVLRLLSDITSIHLDPDNQAEPYRPISGLPRSIYTSIHDLEENQIAFLQAIVAEITDPELQARIADILWVLKRDHQMARLAVSAYIESARCLEHPEYWVATVDRVERALQLAARLGRNGEPFKTVINHLETVLATYDGEDPLYLSARMMGFLQEYKLGDNTHYAELAGKIAEMAEMARDWRRAREYWGLKAKWHQLEKNKEQGRDALLKEAETYVKEADIAVNSHPASYSYASLHLQSAIEALRRVGNTKERIHELHLRLIEYQQQMTSELILHTASINFGELAEVAIKHVTGKGRLDSLLALASISCPVYVERLRSQAVEFKGKYITPQIFPRVLLNAMGRTIAHQPFNAEESLLADMHFHANISRQLHVDGIVEPARWQINSEHIIRVRDFMPFLINNPLIRPGREQIIGRGLNAGMQGDFLVAVHLLIPQLEDSMRYLLLKAGVITSGLDDEGIQDDYNLNRMLSAADWRVPLVKIFGEDFVFDMQGLLVERFGANLRNDMAHGLIDHDSFFSTSGCYLWWLSLRFYLSPRLIQLQESQNSDDTNEASSE